MHSHKDLLIELVKREVKARYKQSLLGYAWVLLVPLVNLVVMTVVFSFFMRIQTGDISYSAFLFSGLVPWLFTLNSITSATNSIIQNKTLVTKIYLPRQIFPLAAIVTKIIDLILSFVIMLVLVSLFGVSLHWTLLFVPIIFIFHLMLVAGICFILSSINVYFRDIENVIGLFLTMWMYLTPVFYPPEMVPEKIMFIFNLNPLTPIINSYRNVILYGTLPQLQPFLYAVFFSVLILIFGFIVFRKLSKNFADVI